jgi:hypothetical protein
MPPREPFHQTPILPNLLHLQIISGVRVIQAMKSDNLNQLGIE